VSPDEFRQSGKAVIDWIADYLEGVEQLPVLPPIEPGWVRAQLPVAPPGQVEPFSAVLADLDRIITPGITHWQHPSFFAYFPANSSPSSILGELVSAGYGVNGMSWATSPAATELETHVVDWMRELLALPEAFIGNGVIQDSASSATLCAILAARDRARASGHSIDSLVGYATAQAHSSIEKGLRVAGIPASRFRKIDTDDAFAMRPDAFAAQVAADIEAGLVPFFVCAARGATSSLAFDPADLIADTCERAGIWLHVDAAMSGIGALCPELRWINDGLDRADSYCTNAHKWMGVNFDCTFFWVRDRGPLMEALSILPEYLRTAATDAGAVIDYRDWQVPLGRRFRALKVWFVLRCEGLDAIQTMIRNQVGWSAEFAQWVADDDRFELMAPVPVNLVCLALRAGDQPTAALIEAVNSSGQALLTRTVLGGRVTCRVSIGSRLTERRHVEALWHQLQSLAG
jgi:aromatic-L-amino-acid decarboxylase